MAIINAVTVYSEKTVKRSMTINASTVKIFAIALKFPVKFQNTNSADVNLTTKLTIISICTIGWQIGSPVVSTVR